MPDERLSLNNLTKPHDLYARIGDKWAHILQTLAAHGYAADSLDHAALKQRLKAAKFRDVVIALAEMRRPPPLPPLLASPSVKQ